MQKYSEKVKPYQVGTKATLKKLEGSKQGRTTFLEGKQEETKDFNPEARQVMFQVCSAIRLNYCKKV